MSKPDEKARGADVSCAAASSSWLAAGIPASAPPTFKTGHLLTCDRAGDSILVKCASNDVN